MIPDLAALLAWIDSLGATGLDGRDLSELGLKNGNLTLFDQRNGKQWEFHDINLSLTRPSGGGVALTMSSEAGERPWLLRATVSRGDGGIRKVEIETERLPAKDLLLALRLGDGQLEPNIPVTARVRAQIGDDGIPKMIEGPHPARQGYIVDADEPLSRIDIDRADFDLQWDATRQALVVPFQILSGGNRITLLAQLDAAARGQCRLGAQDHRRQRRARDRRRAIRIRSCSTASRSACASIPTSSASTWSRAKSATSDLGLAISGGLDYSSGEPRLALGIAGTRMSVAAMKRLWPSFISPKVHAWVSENILSGTVERVLIATNAPLATLKTISPPIPDDGLAIEISGNGAEIRPVHGLPSIKDADVQVRITGRTASVDDRARQYRRVGRPPAHDFERPVRGAGSLHGRAGVARALPHRRLGGGGRRIAEPRAAARLCRLADRSRHQPRQPHGVCDDEHAAEARPAGRLRAIRDESRGQQFLRRTPGHGPEGRGAGAARTGRQSGLRAARRRQDQRHSGAARIQEVARPVRSGGPRRRHARRGRPRAARLRSSAAMSPVRCR